MVVRKEKHIETCGIHALSGWRRVGFSAAREMSGNSGLACHRRLQGRRPLSVFWLVSRPPVSSKFEGVSASWRAFRVAIRPLHMRAILKPQSSVLIREK